MDLVFVPSTLIPSLSQELSQLAAIIVSKQVIDWIANAETQLPYLKGSGYDAFGSPNDPLVTSEGWRRLQDLGIEQG